MQVPPAADLPISSLSRLMMLILAIIGIGGLAGIHRLVARRYITGLLMMATLGGLGFWTVIDCLLIIFGSFRDGDGHIVYRWL